MTGHYGKKVVPICWKMYCRAWTTSCSSQLFGTQRPQGKESWCSPKGITGSCGEMKQQQQTIRKLVKFTKNQICMCLNYVWQSLRVNYIYIIGSVMRAFRLVLTYDPLEDKRIDDVIIKTFFNSLLYKTNRFQVAVRLFSNRSQRTSKCGKNISNALGCTSCTTFLFLPHFYVICDLLLNRCTATWNLFVN